MASASTSAGPRGDTVRSDVWISLTIKPSGGVKISLKSKVASLYGESIEDLLREGISHFGIKHAEVVVEDGGALPFVIMARLESAVRRALPKAELTPWLPEAGPKQKPTEKRRPRRSRLYLPGNSPKLMINAAVHQPDGLILDLEDSVAPAEKDAAQILVRNALIHLDFMGAEKMVRVNQGVRGIEDLKFVVPYGVDLILVPKVESEEEMRDFCKALDEVKKLHGITRPIWLMPIIESAKGAWFAYNIATANESISSLAIGLEDYTADLGVQRTNEGKESLWARQQVINGAKAAGVQAIDTVFSDVSDQVGLLASVIEAKALGFEGKGCIHPRQIAIVHQGFAPTLEEIEKAQKIVLAFEEAEKKGLGVVSLGSKMIDPPVVKRALATVTAALREGLISQNWRVSG